MASAREVTYRLYNKMNGRAYVGSTVDLKRRWWQHRNYLRKGLHYNRLLQKDWNEFGEDAFVFEVVSGTEQEWIDQSPGYNIQTNANGGQVKGFTHTESAKEKIKEARGRQVMVPRTEEWKRNIGNGNRGKVRSEETKRKISESAKGRTAWNKGKPAPEGWIEKMIEAKRRKPISEESRKKLSESVKRGWQKRRGNVERT